MKDGKKRGEEDEREKDIRRNVCEVAVVNRGKKTVS